MGYYIPPRTSLAPLLASESSQSGEKTWMCRVIGGNIGHGVTVLLGMTATVVA